MNYCPSRNATSPSGRPGVVLLAVLIVVAILMLVGYQFNHLMTAEYQAAVAANRVSASRAVADSGLHYAAFILSYPQSVGISDAEDSTLVAPGLIDDNPDVFHLRPVRTLNPNSQAFFSIVSPRDPDDTSVAGTGFRFGVEDESGKLNVNALLRLTGNDRQDALDMLMKLPDMTEEIAEAIINWTQPAGSDPSGNDDVLFYSSLGYSPKYGAYESLEELLLVRDITPRLLLGNDLNRNGVLEPEEDDGSGVTNRGWSRFLTVYSRERNLDSAGQPRIFVNDGDLETLQAQLTEVLGEELANFIVAYRLYGPTSDSGGSRSNRGSGSNNGGSRATSPPLVGQGTPSRQSGSSDSRSGSGQGSGFEMGELAPEDLDMSRQPSAQIESLFALIDAEVDIPRDGQPAKRVRSPLTREDIDGLRDLLPLLWDHVTTQSEMELPPRINVNTAPAEVLLTLPELTEADVEVILEHRPNADSDPARAFVYRTPAWLVTEAGFQPDFLERLESYVTTRSQVFRLQVISYDEQGGPSTRLEAVIDTNDGRPRFLYYRDLTDLGRGFNLAADLAGVR